MRRGKLIDRGMPGVLSQTFRTLIHSRMLTGMSAYEERYKDKDIILLEPCKEDYRMFFTNIFSFASRKAVCEHAYHSTLNQLSRRRDELIPKLAKQGFRLREELLERKDLDLWRSVGLYEKMAKSQFKKTTLRLDKALARLETMVARKNVPAEPGA